jgi:hypothetical protein
MEYFGRNPFVMNILQVIIIRKSLKRKDLSPGNGGGAPLQEPPGERDNSHRKPKASPKERAY